MEVVDFLIELLKFRTITYENSYEDENCLEFIKQFCSDFEAIRVDKPYPNEPNRVVRNLILIKKFGDGEHISFAGHIDVVPPGNGWESEPFIPLVEKGQIFARGSQDMKLRLLFVLVWILLNK